MRPKFKKVLFAGILFLGACKEDPDQTKLQYFPDMADSPAFKTQGNYIDPPEGSISRTAILYPDTIEEAEKVLKNPFRGQPNEEEHRANGKQHFENYCSHCHGLTAKGDGKVTADGKFPRPPDLTSDFYKKKADGFYFYRITFGSALMPAQGHVTKPEWRWEIALHITDLQNNPPATEAAPATTTPDANKGEAK